MWELITTSERLAQFCSQLSGTPFILVDTEFLREKTYWPQLCLIQLAGPDEGQQAAIDPLVPGIDLSPLIALLDAPETTKVFHAGRQDIEIFVQMTGRVPAPIFDTQIAAMVAGLGEQVGYEALVNRLLGLKVDKSQQFTDWSRRPLSERQLEYAILDVVHLRDIYKKLLERLEKGGRTDWLSGETAKLADLSTYQIDPETAWLRFKKRGGSPHALARLRALAAWRERKAQEKDIPRGRLVKDDTLMEMALTHPADLAAMKRVRGLGNHLPERHLQAMLAAMAEATALPIEACPKPEARVQIAPDVEQARDLLKLLLKIVCDQRRVAPRMIADNDDLTRIAEGERDHPVFTGYRADVFGRHARALLDGRLSFRFDPVRRNIAFDLGAEAPASEEPVMPVGE